MESNLCPVPWLNLSIDVNGSVRPCCKFEQPRHGAKRIFKDLRDGNLEEVWNSEGMVRLREDFQRGLRPEECRSCWAEEASGVPSLRQDFIKYRLANAEVDTSTLKPSAPRVLDLKLSNLCNLKCRICSPTASSTFMREVLEHETNNDRNYFIENGKYFRSKKLTDSKKNLEIFKSWLPHLEHVELFGGEPMIGAEVRQIEQLMVDAGVAGRISLLYNTNITVFRDEMPEHWAKFKRVSINLSLDDIGPRLEYERAPCKWPAIAANVQKYSAIQRENIGVSILCTVSTYNAWYMPEFVEHILANFPNLVMRFNFVHGDPEFCVQNLPEEVKEAVSERLRARERLWVEKGLERREHLMGSLEEIVSFMNGAKSNPRHWQRFIERTAEFDRIRNQSFEETFPEFYEVVSPFMGLPEDASRQALTKFTRSRNLQPLI